MDEGESCCLGNDSVCLPASVHLYTQAKLPARFLSTFFDDRRLPIHPSVRASMDSHICHIESFLSSTLHGVLCGCAAASVCLTSWNPSPFASTHLRVSTTRASQDKSAFIPTRASSCICPAYADLDDEVGVQPIVRQRVSVQESLAHEDQLLLLGCQAVLPGLHPPLLHLLHRQWLGAWAQGSRLGFCLGFLVRVPG
jgi:hypothetical protein